jgi:hypothetical protein
VPRPQRSLRSSLPSCARKRKSRPPSEPRWGRGGRCLAMHTHVRQKASGSSQVISNSQIHGELRLQSRMLEVSGQVRACLCPLA